MTVTQLPLTETPARIPVDEWLAYVAMAVRNTEGKYISKAYRDRLVYERGSAPPLTTTYAEELRRFGVAPTEADRVTAAKAIIYLATLNPLMSAHVERIHKATGDGTIADTPEERGLLAGAFGSWLREEQAVARTLALGPRVASEYQGRIGAGHDADVQIVAIVGDRKGHWAITAQDERGNRYAWHETTPTTYPGEFYRLTATVAGHQELQKTRTTLLTSVTPTPSSPRREPISTAG